MSWGYQFLLGLALNAALLVWCLRDNADRPAVPSAGPASPVYPHRASLLKRLNG